MVTSGAPDAIAAVITEEGNWAAAGIAGAKGRKATLEDEFAIASITKTFTAALVMRLAEQGKMNLDEPLASYLGDFKVDTNGATVRQALEMRAGLSDFPQPAAGEHIRMDAAHAWTAEEMVAEMDPPVAAAGEEYRYSSPAYELLARAAEHVTGTSYASALRQSCSTRGTSTESSGRDPSTRRRKPWALPIDRHLGAWTPADLGVGGAIICISSATYAPGAGSIASDAPSLARLGLAPVRRRHPLHGSLGVMAPQGNGFAHRPETSAVRCPLGRGSGGRPAMAPSSRSSPSPARSS